MKTIRIISILLFTIIATNVVGQSNIINQIIDKYENENEFSSIHITKKMLEMISGPEKNEDENIKNIIDNFEEIRMLVNESGSQVKPHINEVIEELKQANYQKLMSLSEDGEKIVMYILEGKNQKIVDFVMLSSEVDKQNDEIMDIEEIFLTIKGELTLQQIVVISEMVDLDLAVIIDF